MAIGGLGLPLSLKQEATNLKLLLPCSTYLIPPGQWLVNIGPYSTLQFLDPVTGLWRGVAQAFQNNVTCIASDGQNYRIANLSGGAIGACVTNAGSAYTSAPTVTASAGGSLWRAVVGGLVNATFTLPSAKGSNYTYAPTIVVQAPPAGGVPCTATCTISAGAINAVTIVDQGAGYTTAPAFYFITDPRDPNNPITFPATTSPITPIGTASQAGTYQVGVLPATATLTGSGTIGAVVCTDPGLVRTALPTLSFAGGGGASAAATVLMNWAVTGFTVTGGGTGYGNAQPFAVRTIEYQNTSATAANTNPAIEKSLTFGRMALLNGTSTAGGAITATASVLVDGGIGFQKIPTMVVDFGGTGAIAPPTVIAVATATVGGQNDYFILMPMGN